MFQNLIYLDFLSVQFVSLSSQSSMFCRRIFFRPLTTKTYSTVPPSRLIRAYTMTATQPLSSPIITNGDLNNVSSMRAPTRELKVDESYSRKSLAIPESEDETEIRDKYRSFLLPKNVTESDWISSLELSTVLKMSEEDIKESGEGRLKVMVLYGSMRKRWVNEFIH